MINLVKILTKRRLKIAFAESCTGGMLSSEITSVSGASKVFSVGLVTYSNQAKITVLKVNKSIAGPNGGTKSKPVGLVYIGVKKNNKLLITKNLFKYKNRKAIQKATVKRTLEIIKSLI
jgi:nicotinamide-nucleotide amidase